MRRALLGRTRMSQAVSPVRIALRFRLHSRSRPAQLTASAMQATVDQVAGSVGHVILALTKQIPDQLYAQSARGESILQGWHRSRKQHAPPALTIHSLFRTGIAT